MLTTCNKLDGTIRLVTRLFQQDGYSYDVTITALCCEFCDNLVTAGLYQSLKAIL